MDTPNEIIAVDRIDLLEIWKEAQQDALGMNKE